MPFTNAKATLVWELLALDTDSIDTDKHMILHLKQNTSSDSLQLLRLILHAAHMSLQHS